MLNFLFISYHFLTLRWQRSLKSSFMEDKESDPFILHIQYMHMYHVMCWLPALPLPAIAFHPYSFLSNTFRPRCNGKHFADDIYKCIFFNENIWISVKISLKVLLTIFQHRTTCDWDIANSIFDLENSRSAWVIAKVNPMVTFEALSLIDTVCLSFCGNWTIFGWDIKNSLFDLENARSRLWPRSNPMVTFEA